MTVTSYLYAIPTTAPEYPLAQTILSKINLAASTTNASLAIAAQQELPGLTDDLVFSLIARRRITSATILNLAAAVAPLGTTNFLVPDTGILGGVTVSGGNIAISPGAY
jgi:hypothetical protein